MIRKISVLPIALAAALCLASASAGFVAPLSRGETLDLPALDEAIPRPEAVLGYPLGSRFTSWDDIQRYLEALAEASPRVEIEEYGRTYEGRPLRLLTISSPENLARIEEVRRGIQRLADPAGLSAAERERLTAELPAVIWLAYGVHGNESSSAEAAMAAAYVFAASQGETAELLGDVVILLDPLSNPDGRERYVGGYRQRVGDEANPRRFAAEHFEPWPGGRQNHYVIDLNRDWAWASQQETRYRLAAYRAWEPQVYVDFHEMGSASSYFFPPSAEPIHPRIDRRVLSWLDTFGRGNAQAFDRQGWVYFKEESFDLFYPGYGDSYPSLRGAVGMTYEVAGGGRAGLAVNLPDGSTLTLADRVGRHLTTSLSTVETAAREHRRLVADFAATRAKAAAGPGRSFLWRADQQEAGELAGLLALHGIRVRQLTRAADVPVRSLTADGEPAPRRFPAGTYVVSTAQPLGSLAAALLDLESPMSDRFLERQRQRLEQNLPGEFYDITAWSLPLAFNLEAWVSPGEVGTAAGATRPVADAPAPGSNRPLQVGSVQGDGRLGFLVRPQGLASYRFAAALQRRGVRHRVALEELAGPGGTYAPGTLFIPAGELREESAGVRRELEELAGETGVSVEGIDASFGFQGLSLGSNRMPPVRPVRIGLVGGEGVDPTSFGFLWHLLDRQIETVHDRLDVTVLSRIDLGEYDALVLPSGGYGLLDEDARKRLDGWVRNGGLLVAVGDAVAWLQRHELTSVKRWEPAKEDGEGSAEPQAEDPESSENPVDNALARRDIYTPGAVLATRMAERHPLTLGLASAPPVLYEGTLILRPTGDPRRDVLTAADSDPVIAGLAWPEAEQRLAGSLLVGLDPRGRGSVLLFAQDPSFRLFWRATTPILLNALLYGPSAGVAERY